MVKINLGTFVKNKKIKFDDGSTVTILKKIKKPKPKK